MRYCEKKIVLQENSFKDKAAEKDWAGAGLRGLTPTGEEIKRGFPPKKGGGEMKNGTELLHHLLPKWGGGRKKARVRRAVESRL